MSNLKPFKIEVPQAALDDLKARLERTRWPDEPEGAAWAYGTNLGYMRNLVEYWKTGYDWRKHEKALNALSQFRTEVDGVGLHFVHERGQGPDAAPLLLLHGWPDSFFRYHKLIPRLTRAEGSGKTFDVVVPSLPGFGFSDHRAMSTEAMADLLVKLMRDALGYRTFLVSGGDVGGPLAMAMARQYPDAVRAIHLTDVGYPTGQEDFSTFSPAEIEFAQAIQKWWMGEGAYNMIQSTKPQTLAFAMNDSPAGWAAWVMSFVCTGIVPTRGEEMEKRLGRDELLTNIMIYWVTQTIASSFRCYYEVAHAQPSPGQAGKAKVPAAVAHCEKDAPLPREWAERNVELLRFSELPGGHFAAWEQPDAFAADLRGMLADLEKAR